MTPVRFRPLALLLSLALSSASCALAPTAPPPSGPRDTVVLLPDEDGGTGAVVVGSSGRERRLARPMEALRVAAGSPPGAPFLMDEPGLRALAGAAIDARPEAPLCFRLHFEKGGVELTPESETAYREALGAILARGAVDVSVVGHTDTQGDKAYNDRLSMRRAEAVAARLVRDGISPAILEITSHGKDNPLVPTGDQVAEPRNRRVEVTVR